MSGVKNAEVFFDEKEAIVTYATRKATVEDLIEALQKVRLQGSFKAWGS